MEAYKWDLKPFLVPGRSVRLQIEVVVGTLFGENFYRTFHKSTLAWASLLGTRAVLQLDNLSMAVSQCQRLQWKQGLSRSLSLTIRLSGAMRVEGDVFLFNSEFPGLQPSSPIP